MAEPPPARAAAEATPPAAATGPVAVGRCFQLKEGRTPDGTAYMVLVVKGKVGPGDMDETVEAVDRHWFRFQCDLYVDLAGLEFMGQEVVKLLETLDAVARRHERVMVLGWVPARIRRILPLVKARLKVIRLFPEEGA
ncbi:MAG: hypothetical protein HY722_09685 [Planctomycetes bacterium]|nr:hypothetical protein [Planctomycetota bacterium]